jgi:hypothetical protein
MRKLLWTLALAALPLASAQANVVITFGQTSGSNTLTATPNGTDTATSLSAQNVTINVSQCIAGPGCLGAEFLDITATSTDQAQQVGTAVTQHYNGSFEITSLPSGGVNILSGTFTDAVFGSGPQLTLAVGAPPDTLTLSSDIIPAADLAQPNAIGFTFTNVSPPVSAIGSGCAQFPNSVQPCTLGQMTAAIAGNASATSAVAEPSALALLAAALLCLTLVRGRSA